MISNKKELKFYILADKIMNGINPNPSIGHRLKNLFYPNKISKFLMLLRKCQYYSDLRGGRALFIYYRMRFAKISRDLGFSIGYKVFGYGLVIPHYGTIVVGGSNRIGNYCVLHTSTCITDNGKTIGNGLYVATGAKIIRKVVLGDNVSIAANSVVNNDFPDGNCLLAGMPAIKKADTIPWFERDGKAFIERVNKVETLKQQMGL